MTPENAIERPARVHTKWRMRYHARIQKKWNKRYGYVFIERLSAGRRNVEPPNVTGFPALDEQLRGGIQCDQMFVLRGRPRQRTPKREDGHFVDPEQNRLANEEALIGMAVTMLHDIRNSNGLYTSAHFNCANQAEVDFLRAYMDREAPALPVTYTIV